jgi:hypothetical protein
LPSAGGNRLESGRRRQCAAVRCGKVLGARANSAGPACTALAVAMVVVLAFVWLPGGTRWSFLVPLVPALTVALAIRMGKEKTCAAEIGVSLAFSGAAFPVAAAAGATIPTAATITMAFATTFVLATLAVRVVILKVRGGGDPTAAMRARRVVLALGSGMITTIILVCLWRGLSWTALAASGPGVAVALRLAVAPPSASRLRAVGWTLVAMSAVTAGESW